MDQVGPNGGMGVVQSGVDVSVEEHVPINQGEQRFGLSSPEEQSLGDHAKSMVAIPHEQASGACPSDSKLKLIRDNFKDAKLGKISTRDRKEMGGACDYGEEDSSEQTRGMLYEGEFARGEDDTVCGGKDQWHHPYQSNIGDDGDSQPFGDSVSREIGEEARDDGGIEVERH